jgi:hypothetical protein
MRCFYILRNNSTEIKVSFNFETIINIDVICIILCGPPANVLVRVLKTLLDCNIL